LRFALRRYDFPHLHKNRLVLQKGPFAHCIIFILVKLVFFVILHTGFLLQTTRQSNGVGNVAVHTVCYIQIRRCRCSGFYE